METLDNSIYCCRRNPGGRYRSNVFLGLFDEAKDATGARTLAASLALIGAVLSTAVTLVGIVVKYSIDDRNAQLAAVESGRNYLLSVEAGDRNRTDVAIRAVSLLSENNKDTTMHQIGGALLALANLGELELSVSLLATLWPNCKVSTQVADVILQKALQGDSDYVKRNAAEVLRKKRNLGVSDWPIPDMHWLVDLPNDCRLSLILAACDWFISNLERDKSRLPVAAIVIHEALARLCTKIVGDHEDRRALRWYPKTRQLAKRESSS